MQKQINKYDCLSTINDCTHWHINLPTLLLCLCVVFYSLFVYTCVCVFLHIQSPLLECRSIRSGASGLPYYCTQLVCVSAVMELLAVWRHNKPTTKKPKTKNQYTDTWWIPPWYATMRVLGLPFNIEDARQALTIVAQGCSS